MTLVLLFDQFFMGRGWAKRNKRKAQGDLGCEVAEFGLRILALPLF
jgi:hypothetical protein